jgi:hypothetical protein
MYGKHLGHCFNVCKTYLGHCFNIWVTFLNIVLMHGKHLGQF